MANVPFKFAIIDTSLNYYSVRSGNVFASGTPAYLSQSVVDWATLTLNYRRDTTFLGIIRSYSPQKVRFAKDGATILRFIKNTTGRIEAIAYLGVYLLNNDTQQYYLLDYWQFDFSKSSNSQLYFECGLMDGGLSALLKAYQTQNVNIPLNDPSVARPYPPYNPLPANQINLQQPVNPATDANVPTPKMFYIDGIPILGQFQFATTTTGEEINVGNEAAIGSSFAMDVSQSFGDFNGSLGTAGSPVAGWGAGSGPVNQSAVFTAASNVSGLPSMPVNISINFNLQCTYIKSTGAGQTPGKLQLTYSIWNAPNPDTPNNFNGQRLGPVIIWEDSNWVQPGDTGVVNTKGATPYITMNPGEILLISLNCLNDGLGALGLGVIFPPYDITVTYPLPAITLNGSFVPPSSVCRVISHYDLFNYLRFQIATLSGILANVDGVPNELYASRSNLLTTKRDPTAVGNYDLNPTDTYFTCADSLRGLNSVTISDPNFPAPGDPSGIAPGTPIQCYIVPAIYTNITDFAKDLLVDLCASIGIEKYGLGSDVLVAESLDYFFDDTIEIADLGDEISNFEMSDYTDYVGTTISAGQTDQQFDSLNGPYETNSEVDWSTPITRIIQSIDYKSPYRTEALGIEETRANIGNKTNVNSSSDNDTFKLQADGTGLHTVAGLANWSGTTGYFNIISQINDSIPLVPETFVVGVVTGNTITNSFFSDYFVMQISISVGGVTTVYYEGVSFTQALNSSGLPTGTITGIATGPLPLNFVGGETITVSGVAVFTIIALTLQRPYSATNPNIGIFSGLPQNLLSPQIGNLAWYNLCFSPQRKMRRMAPWLCSNYASLVNNLMAISGYKKNIKLISNLGSGTVNELDWFNISDTTPQTYVPPYSLAPVTVAAQPIPAGKKTIKIFQPYVFTFTSQVPINLPLLMSPPGTPDGGKMYGKIKFTFKRDDGDIFPLAGFVLEAGITPGTNNVYNYRLLCSPTVNIPANL